MNIKQQYIKADIIYLQKRIKNAKIQIKQVLVTIKALELKIRNKKALL